MAPNNKKRSNGAAYFREWYDLALNANSRLTIGINSTRWLELALLGARGNSYEMVAPELLIKIIIIIYGEYDLLGFTARIWRRRRDTLRSNRTSLSVSYCRLEAEQRNWVSLNIAKSRRRRGSRCATWTEVNYRSFPGFCFFFCSGCWQ